MLELLTDKDIVETLDTEIQEEKTEVGKSIDLPDERKHIQAPSIVDLVMNDSLREISERRQSLLRLSSPDMKQSQSPVNNVRKPVETPKCRRNGSSAVYQDPLNDSMNIS